MSIAKAQRSGKAASRGGRGERSQSLLNGGASVAGVGRVALPQSCPWRACHAFGTDQRGMGARGGHAPKWTVSRRGFSSSGTRRRNPASNGSVTCPQAHRGESHLLSLRGVAVRVRSVLVDVWPRRLGARGSARRQHIFITAERVWGGPYRARARLRWAPEASETNVTERPRFGGYRTAQSWACTRIKT